MGARDKHCPDKAHGGHLWTPPTFAASAHLYSPIRDGALEAMQQWQQRLIFRRQQLGICTTCMRCHTAGGVDRSHVGF